VHKHDQCDNTRPYCRKCLDGGRDCAGYERETVFIIGTIEDQGRCSSHPPRVVKSKKGGGKSSAAATSGSASASAAGSRSGSRRGSEEEEWFGEGEGWSGSGGLEVREPLRPAWDDLVSVVWRGRGFRLQVAGLYTDMRGVVGGGEGEEGGYVSLPGYVPPDVQPRLGEEEFGMRARCLVHLVAPDVGQGPTDSICLFLYEVSCCGVLLLSCP
jgi:hypothetical protein